MGKYTLIPENTFSRLVLGTGVLALAFDTDGGELDEDDIWGTTTGKTEFCALPHYTDMADKSQNCPKNVAGLKRLDYWEAKLSGTMVSVAADTLKKLAGAASVTSECISAQKKLTDACFGDLWLIADYSDVTSGTDAGYIAVRLKNALNTSGVDLELSNGSKGEFAFSFLAHSDVSSPQTPPYEIYIHAGQT